MSYFHINSNTHKFSTFLWRVLVGPQFHHPIFPSGWTYKIFLRLLFCTSQTKIHKVFSKIFNFIYNIIYYRKVSIKTLLYSTVHTFNALITPWTLFQDILPPIIIIPKGLDPKRQWYLLIILGNIALTYYVRMLCALFHLYHSQLRQLSTLSSY